ncbi:MAG TPA: hypothetical protein PKD86_02885 [Gemmatales bacterium]|nr:hypothetical protein [Gemmatales bacterium]HMP58277.1 hypothetical protein [Gemmatales bacterium]
MATQTLTKRHTGSPETGRLQPRTASRYERMATEATLRDLAFVLKLTERVKAEIQQDVTRN